MKKKKKMNTSFAPTVNWAENVSPEDRRRLDAWARGVKGRKLPKFETDTKGNPSIVPASSEPHEQLMHLLFLAEKLGVHDRELAFHLANQLLKASPGRPEAKATAANAALAAVYETHARDPLEAMLLVQMISVHNHAMASIARAGLAEQTHVGIEANISLASKLMRTYIAQLEVLNRHRGKGQQRVTVEHVTVNQGGQAIVGSVNPPGGEG